MVCNPADLAPTSHVVATLQCVQTLPLASDLDRPEPLAHRLSSYLSGSCEKSGLGMC